MNLEKSAGNEAQPTLIGQQLPDELRKQEEALVAVRRRRASLPTAENKKLVGVALSGGGIRSATFCLGLFQGLAKHKVAENKNLLGHIDYLSTVSGGGYFGSFFGRMFTRDWAKQSEAKSAVKPEAKVANFDVCAHRETSAKQFLAKFEAKDFTSPMNRVAEALKNDDSPPLTWLRGSGNYIAPGGPNDGMLALAVYLRNWISLLLVLLLPVLTMFVVLNLIRAELWQSDFYAGFENGLAAAAGEHLWWTPVLLLPVFGLVFFVLPLGMAYWLTQKYKAVRWAYWLVFGAGIVAAVAAIVVAVWLGDCACPSNPAECLPGLVVAGIAAMAFLYHWLSERDEPAVPPTENKSKTISAEQAAQEKIEAKNKSAKKKREQQLNARNKLSAWLRVALLFTLGALALALFDAWGQTLYALVSYAGNWRQAWPAFGGLTSLGLAGVFVRAQLLKGGGTGKWRVAFQTLALAVGLLLVATLLTGISFTSHALLWGGHLAKPAETKQAADSPGGKIYHLWLKSQNEVALSAERHIEVRPPVLNVNPLQACDSRPGVLALLRLAGVTLVAGLLCWYFGGTLGFLNLSSFHTLYSARITRAYQGASSLKRWEADAEISRVEPDDDQPWAGYQPWENGGPLHLINCAANCTENLETGAESTNAKALNLCVGPVGISVGQHHQNFEQLKLTEPLTLGQWVGISGAAFTTGLGNVGGMADVQGTSFGPSLVCGLFNIRLGYWWFKGAAFGRNGAMPGAKSFAVQRYLLDELTGHFSLINQPHWYLSDGGHFENTAAYELIRRRVSFIILADCGADPDGECDDLGNLTRRVRIDFKAELKFLEGQLLAEALEISLGELTSNPIGTLADLRLEKNFIGRPSEERTASAIQSIQADDTGPAQARRVKKYAALAEVAYQGPDGKKDDKNKTLILIIKPGLIGNESAAEPADLINYQRKNPEFPQQTTLDQFFDEAQWESYRKLGELEMEALLTEGSWLERKLNR